MKAIRSIAALMIIYAFVFLPNKAYAVTPPLLSFGGIPDYTYPCTCSVAEWGYFGPLFLSAVPVTGPMVYYPAATYLFPNYLPTVPSIPHLGAYMPGVQACWEYAVYACFPLPSVGVMAFVGTGLSEGN